MDEQDKKGAEEGSRARNRTVMLTPDVTSQVRNRLAQELREGGASDAAPNSRGGFEPPRPFGGGFSGDRGDRGGSTGRKPELAAAHAAESIAPQTIRTEGSFWAKESPIVGFLVAYDRNEHGEVFELRSGRIMVTTAARPDENTLVLIDDTVSPMHAILRITAEGEIQVLDQLSEHGTSISRAEGETVSLSGDKGDLHHGDVVSFGARAFHVCLVPRRTATE